MHAGREDLGKGSLGFEECRVVFVNVILLLHEDLCDIGECQVILHSKAVAVIIGHQGKVWEHRETGVAALVMAMTMVMAKLFLE